MDNYFFENLWPLWAIMGVVCLILELTTGGFYIICFAVGAIAALVVSLLGMSFGWQLAAFAVVSAVAIFTVRPFAMKYLHENKPAPVSNADAIIGRIGRVSETITAGHYGRVAIDGDDWKAQASTTTTDIAKGSQVRVVGRDSLIIDVEPIKIINN